MSVERDLQEEAVGRLDLSPYVLVHVGTQVDEVLHRMRESGLATVLVTDGDGRLTGIFTERDVLHKVATTPANLHVAIEMLMTPSPRTVRARERVATALRLMNEGHFRHVPVVDDDGRLVGNLAHYAIVRFLADRLQDKVYNVAPDPERVARAPEGA